MPRSLAFTFLMFALFSCSRKHHPERSRTADNEKISTVNRNDSLLAKKTVIKPTKKDIIPRVIVVNDNAAHKSVDGRYYYDLLGHRYWKNNKDGKYYLFNKSMYNNDAFKAPSK
jgi:hypothetical protein